MKKQNQPNAKNAGEKLQNQLQYSKVHKVRQA